MDQTSVKYFSEMSDLDIQEKLSNRTNDELMNIIIQLIGIIRLYIQHANITANK